MLDYILSLEHMYGSCYLIFFGEFTKWFFVNSSNQDAGSELCVIMRLVWTGCGTLNDLDPLRINTIILFPVSP